MGLEVGQFFRVRLGGEADPLARRLEQVNLENAVVNFRTDLSIYVVSRDGYLKIYVPGFSVLNQLSVPFEHFLNDQACAEFLVRAKLRGAIIDKSAEERMEHARPES